MGVRVPPLARIATLGLLLRYERMSLDISVEQIKSWKIALKIKSDATPVEREIERLYGEYAHKAEIPGFRKGKAPRDLVKARYGKSIESEAVENAIPSVYRQAIKEKDVNPITQAEIDEVNFEPSKELSFKATFEIVPEFEVKDYEGLSITNKDAKPSKDAIEKRIEALRQMNANLEPVKREARTGDLIVVDYRIMDEKKHPVPDGKVSNYSLLLGETGQKELDEGLLGVKAGDDREVLISFSHQVPLKGVAGKKLPVRMKIKEVKERLVPELNEAFARDIGADSLKELIRKVTEELSEKTRMRVRAEWEKEVTDGLIERNRFEPPQSLVETFVGGAGVKDYENAVWLAKRVILLEKLAKALDISAEQEDVNRRVEKIAEDLGFDFRVMRDKLEIRGRIEQIKSSIKREKVLDYLIDKAKKR